MKLTKKQNEFLDICKSMYESNSNNVQHIKNAVIELFINDLDSDTQKEYLREIFEMLEHIESFSSMPCGNYEKTLK